MSPTKQRIAIAQACGWKLWTQTTGKVWHDHGLRRPDGSRPVHGSEADYYFKWSDAVSDGVVPDYLNDLNAMHEAEKVAIYDKNLGLCFLNRLQDVCNVARPAGWDTTSRTLPCTSATAAQRAEAFLRTLNLWTE